MSGVASLLQDAARCSRSFTNTFTQDVCILGRHGNKEDDSQPVTWRGNTQTVVVKVTSSHQTRG